MNGGWHVGSEECMECMDKVTKCIVALRVGIRGRKLYHSVSRGHFLFTSSDTFAVGCIVQPQNTPKNELPNAEFSVRGSRLLSESKRKWHSVLPSLPLHLQCKQR